MPFGLKNPEATYQRLVNQIFSKQNWGKCRSICRWHAYQE